MVNHSPDRECESSNVYMLWKFGVIYIFMHYYRHRLVSPLQTTKAVVSDNHSNRSKAIQTWLTSHKYPANALISNQSTSRSNILKPQLPAFENSCIRKLSHPQTPTTATAAAPSSKEAQPITTSTSPQSLHKAVNVQQFKAAQRSEPRYLVQT
ncbi:hypothetical protein YC2023_002595 [Brassica napus]